MLLNDRGGDTQTANTLAARSERDMIGWLIAILLVNLVAAQEKPRNIWEQQYAKRSPEELAAQFENDARPVYRHRADIARLLELRPGQVVADIGAGSGFLSRIIAAEVGSTGSVTATELDPRMVDYINARARKAGLPNLTAIIGQRDSTGLPPNSMDVIVVVNTFSFFDNPSAMAASIARALRPRGLLMIVDFPPNGGEGIDPSRVTEICRTAGLDRLDTSAVVPGHFVIRFRKGGRLVDQSSRELASPDVGTAQRNGRGPA